jgi:hypothetical protein
MKVEQSRHIIRQLTERGIQFVAGLSDEEVAQVEARFQFQFPPDLRAFLQMGLPISSGFVDWRNGLRSEDEAINLIGRLDWPLEGMLFDIQHNNFWVEDWGIKPNDFDLQAEIARRYYDTYPKLIPIYSHRYISSQPHVAGNPVFSVYQMDIIYYGYDLVTYFANEFSIEPLPYHVLPEEPRVIAFWSEWVG